MMCCGRYCLQHPNCWLSLTLTWWGVSLVCKKWWDMNIVIMQYLTEMLCIMLCCQSIKYAFSLLCSHSNLKWNWVNSFQDLEHSTIERFSWCKGTAVSMGLVIFVIQDQKYISSRLVNAESCGNGVKHHHQIKIDCSIGMAHSGCLCCLVGSTNQVGMADLILII